MVKRTLRAVRVHERLEVLRAFHQFAFRRRARVAHRRIVRPRDLVLDARPVVAARGEGRHDVEPLVDPRGVDAPDRRIHVGIAQEGAALRGSGRRVCGAGLDGPVARRRQGLSRTVHRHDERFCHAGRPRGPPDAREDLALRHVAEDVEKRTSPRHLLVAGLAHRLGEMRHLLVRVHMVPQHDGAEADLVAERALQVELPRPGNLPEMVFAARAAPRMKRHARGVRILAVPAVGEVVDARVDRILQLAVVFGRRAAVVGNLVRALRVGVVRRQVPVARRRERPRLVAAEPRVARRRAVPVDHAHPRRPERSQGSQPDRDGTRSRLAKRFSCCHGFYLSLAIRSG